MRSFIRAILAEPNLVLGVIRAGLAMAVGFGLGLSGEQVALTVTFCEVLFAMISRALSTSVSQPTLPAGTPVTVVTPEGEPNRVVTV